MHLPAPKSAPGHSPPPYRDGLPSSSTSSSRSRPSLRPFSPASPARSRRARPPRCRPEEPVIPQRDSRLTDLAGRVALSSPDSSRAPLLKHERATARTGEKMCRDRRIQSVHRASSLWPGSSPGSLTSLPSSFCIFRIFVFSSGKSFVAACQTNSRSTPKY